MSDCRIGVVGAAGRMGRVLLRLAATTPGYSLAAGSERPGAAELGRDLGSLAGIEELGLTLGDKAEAVFAASDVVLDFTSPAATLAHAALAAASGKAHVIGTTGIDAAGEAKLAEAAARAPIVYCGNMSLGVNLLAELVTQVARALDPAWDIEIVEMHHRHKVDAPSGHRPPPRPGRRVRAQCEAGGGGRSRPRRHHRRAQERRASASPPCAAAMSSASIA